MASSGEKLGEAYIDIDARYEQVIAALKEVETATDAQMKRLGNSMSYVGGEMRETEKAGVQLNVSLWQLFSTGKFFYDVWNRGLTATIAGYVRWATTAASLIPILGRLVTVAAMLVPVLVTVATASAIFHAIAFAATAAAAAVDIFNKSVELGVKAWKGDAETARYAIQSIGDELSRIPLVGRAMGAALKTAFGAIRGDQDLVTEGFADWRSYMLEFPVLGWALVKPIAAIQEAFTGNEAAIEAALLRMRELREETALMQRIAEGTGPVLQAGLDRALQLQNQLVLAQLSGIDRVREEQRQLATEERSQHQARMNDLNQQLKATLAPLQRRREVDQLVRAANSVVSEERGLKMLADEGIDGGLLNEEGFNAQANQIKAKYAAAEAQERTSFQNQLNARRGLAQIAGQAAADEATRAAATEKMAIEEAHREKEDTLRRLGSELLQSQLMLEGRTAEAKAEAIRSEFNEKILAAVREGDEARAALQHRLYAARMQELQEQERASGEAQLRAMRSSSERIQDELRKVERSIRREQLPANDAKAAEKFDVNAEFDDRVEQATQKILALREQMDALREGGVTPGEQEQLTHLAHQVELLDHMAQRLNVLRKLKLNGIDDAEGPDTATPQARERRDRESIAVNLNRFSVGGSVQGAGNDPAQSDRKEMRRLLGEIAKNTKNPVARWG